MALISTESPSGSEGPRTPDRILDLHTHLLRRTLAAIVDYFGIWAIAAVCAYGLGAASTDGESITSSLPFLGDLLFIAAYTVYFVALESLFGRTLGKWLFDLAVVTPTGGHPDPIESFKRHLLDPVDFCMCFIPALAIVKLSPTHQRLGDMFARTWVVSTVPPCSTLRETQRNAA